MAAKDNKYLKEQSMTRLLIVVVGLLGCAVVVIGVGVWWLLSSKAEANPASAAVPPVPSAETITATPGLGVTAPAMASPTLSITPPGLVETPSLTPASGERVESEMLAGETWSEPIEIGPGDESNQGANYPALAVAETGRLYLAYSSNEERVFLAYSDDAGQHWSGPVEVAQGVMPTLLLADKQLYLFYIDQQSHLSTPANLQLKVSPDNGASWGPLAQVNQIPQTVLVNERAAVTAASSGELYALWSGTEGVYFSRSDGEGQGWQGEQLYRPGGSRPYLAVDPANQLYVIWSQSEQIGQPEQIFLSQSRNQGDSWSSPAIIQANAYPFGLALAPTGQIFVSWHSRENNEERPYLSIAGNNTPWGFIPLTPETMPALLAWSELGIDADGHLYAAWLNGFGPGLYLSRSLNGQKWDPPQEIHRTQAGRSFPMTEPMAMAVTRDSAVYLAWVEAPVADPTQSHIYFTASQPQLYTGIDPNSTLLAIPTATPAQGMGGLTPSEPTSTPTPLPTLPPTNCPTEGVQVTLPKPGAIFREPLVSIVGTANIPRFNYWKVEYATSPGGWNYLLEKNEPVNDSQLYEFNTTTVPAGLYGVRLTVVDQTGNYPEPCEIWFYNIH